MRLTIALFLTLISLNNIGCTISPEKCNDQCNKIFNVKMHELKYDGRENKYTCICESH